MKGYHYILMFLVVFLGMSKCYELQEKCAIQVEEDDRLLKYGIEHATDAAADSMETFYADALQIDAIEVMDVFFDHLYACLGVLDQKEKRQYLEAGLMFMVIVGESGYCVCQKSDTENTDKTVQKKDKILFQNMGGYEWSAWKDFREEEKWAEQLEEELNRLMIDVGMVGKHSRNNVYFPMNDGWWQREFCEPGIMVCWKQYITGTPINGKSEQLYFSGAVIHRY